MAAARPVAVVMRASEMPGATTARLAEPMRPMSSNAVMIPQTVPKSPMNGVTLAVVARKLRRRSRRVTSTVAARASERERDSRLLTVGRGADAPGAARDEAPNPPGETTGLRQEGEGHEHAQHLSK